MRVLAVPFDLGTRVAALAAPDPHEVIAPAVDGDGPAARMASLFRDVAERVAGVERPLVYAGDCMAPMGVLAGLQRRGVDPTVIWFDAHGDFHTWETSRSGYIGGMPLAMAVGRGEQTIVRGCGLRPLAEDQCILVDARAIDPGEDDAVRGSGVRWVKVPEVEAPAGPIYVHLDVDVVDPEDMPGLQYPEAGGPRIGEVMRAIERLAGSGRVVGVTVACTWKRDHVEAAHSAAAARRLIAPFLADGASA